MQSNLAIFASGSGSNAEKIISYFKDKDNNSIKVSAILSNKASAFVLERATQHSIETLVFNRRDFYASNTVLNFLKERGIDWIILAGFLWLIPEELIKTFPKRIINIHPSLLPKYGGKGMYGKHVHQAVFDNFEEETGITIHYVNEAYDEGQIILQKSVTLDVTDTPDIIAQKVQQLEHLHFPKIIEKTILEQ